uniref:SAP domain-containing protein n=1 Tax=Meloidogyne enterolobii TaxID=390850 RepID=A0A6V7WL52_MELEN|nr:unnamed protein product [Meloidogyne enterolobii]
MYLKFQASPRAFFWRTQRFTLKRTSSESDIGKISPKRIKLLTPIVDKEFVDGTPDKFLEEAGLFRDSSPREAASKLWLGAVYSVKILFIRYHINILTHDALKIFCDIAIDSSKIFAKSELVHAWTYAKKLYSYSVDESRCLSKETYDTYMDEAIEKFLDEFFCKPTCTEKKVKERAIVMGGEKYTYNIIYTYLLLLTLLMASKEELEKLTVAQIREKLKSRKLPASGPKSELVTRLFDSLMAEERLLEEGPGGESIDLSGVNMDEVLGLDDEKDTHSSITANEDIEEGKEKQPASCDNSDESMKNNDEEKGANKTDDRKEEEIKGKLITREDQTKRKGTTDEDVKMLKLAERVGLPVKRRVSESESDDILAKREKRFGSFSGNKEGEKILTKKDEEEAKEKRAARFGLTDEKRKTTDEDSKMLKRAERFGLPLKRGGASESEQSEILAKREKRFGKVIGSGDTETKKEARIKRFGVVS